jgi:hypothetical protein
VIPGTSDSEERVACHQPPIGRPAKRYTVGKSGVATRASVRSGVDESDVFRAALDVGAPVACWPPGRGNGPVRS